MRLMTMVTAAATVVLAFLGWQTLVASTRAWVWPVRAVASIDDKGFVAIEVTYKNSGKEPAVEFGDDWADDWAASIRTGTTDVNFYDNCTSDGGLGRCGERAVKWQQANCDEKLIFQDRVAFPDFSYTRLVTGLQVDRSDVNKIVVLQGCFVYKSNITFLGTIHRSAFCYYYRVGQPGNEMRACPVGNSAT